MKTFFLPVTVTSLLALCATACSAQDSVRRGDWPQWRGPNRDGISSDTGLLKEWPEDGPEQLWQIDSVGVGYSSLAVKDGRIITQGDLGGVEHIIALDVKDGRILWAVQPEPVVEQLRQKIEAEIRRLDADSDGTVTEVEALARFGWNWNKFNKPDSSTPEAVADRRSAALLTELDKNSDGFLTFDEAGRLLRNEWARIDVKDPDVDVDSLAASRTTEYVRILDKDSDGRISRKESRGSLLDRSFGRFDQKDPDTRRGDDVLTAAELQAGLVRHEAGRDGRISGAELHRFYIASRATGDGVLTAQELRMAVGGYRNGQGDGPRGTPAIDENRVYAEGGNGDLVCLDVTTGETLWYVNLSSDFGGGRPGWGYSESPLVVDDMLIVTPGGRSGTLLALNKMTGAVIWQSAEQTEGAHYSSPSVASIHGVRQIVQFGRQSVFGVSLQDGSPLWKYSAPANGTANCCAPIIDGNLVFASSAYGTGGGLAKVTLNGSIQVAEEVYFEKKMACHHGGIVKVGDYMYSCGGGTLICMEFATGEIKWQSRAAGKGSLCYADGMLYLLGERHEVALVQATPEGYSEAGRFRIESHGRPAWAHPVVTGGRLYIRDQQSLSVYDVAGK